MKGQLPTYKISNDSSLSEDGEHLGIDMIAATATPAILTTGMAFNGIIPKEFKFTDDSKLRLVAPILIPDLEIYRRDEELGEYNVVFTKDKVEELYQDFQDRKDRGEIKEAFNLEHDSEQISPSYILESWLVGKDTKADRAFSEFGIEVPRGTVMVVAQFRDKKYFQEEIIDKQRFGFSIEGFLGMEMSEQIINKIKQNKMEKQKFEKAVLADGTGIFVTKNEVDGEVYVIDDNGDRAPIFDGEHKLEDGSTIVTVDGKITEIKQVEKEKKEEVVVEAAEEVVEEEVETVKDSVMDESMVIEIVKREMEDIYEAIAELKNALETEKIDEADVVDTKMNSQEALASFFKRVGE